MENEEIITGLLDSPLDHRDFPLSAVAPATTRIPEAMQPPFDMVITDQGSVPSCVGHSCAAIKQYQESKERISAVFDGDWIYRQCKLTDGMPGVSGTFFRAGMKVLMKSGAMPLGGGSPDRFRIGSYAQVDDISFEGLKIAIFLYGTVLAGFIGSNAGWKKELIREPREGEKQWKHAVALVGYDKDYLVIQNSWGIKSGNKGFFKTSKDYLPFEAWVVLTDLPTPDAGTSGWVAKDYVSQGKITADKGLNVREKPGIKSKIIKVLPKGTVVKENAELTCIEDGILWEFIITN